MKELSLAVNSADREKMLNSITLQLAVDQFPNKDDCTCLWSADWTMNSGYLISNGIIFNTWRRAWEKYNAMQ